ncbi:MAG: InlB B-repeat-containing protein, partial [Solirubrobacterales bacterium]
MKSARNFLPLVTLLALVLLGGVASASPLAPIQVSSLPFSQNDPANFRWQQTAINPTNGKGMIVGFISTGPTGFALNVAQPIDATGASDGSATTLVANSFTSSPARNNTQPSVAYNPATGGWLACYADDVVDKLVCQHLNADGSLSGSAFPISSVTNLSRAQTSIAWSPVLGKFAVMFSYDNTAAVRLVDPSGGTSGAIIPVPFDTSGGGSISGGSDIAYSPTSNTFMVTFRASAALGESPAPWVWLLDGNAQPLGSAVRSASDTSRTFGSGSLTHNRSRNEFDLVASESDGLYPIEVQRFSAVDGSKVGSPSSKVIASPLNNYSYYRPVIAANPFTGEDLIAVPLVDSSASNHQGIYALSFNADSGIGDPELVAGGADGYPTETRPRLSFNSYTCQFLTTYTADTGSSDGWQLFSARYAPSSDCLYALTVAKHGTGSGTVTSSPAGIDCGSSCSGSFSVGTSVTLTATAASGSKFSSWGGACSGSAPSCTVTIDQARSVSATFDSNPEPTEPRLRVALGGAKKVGAGRGFMVGIRVRNVGSGKAESVKTCLKLPRALFLIEAKGAKASGQSVCWTRSSLGAGKSVSFKAKVRSSVSDDGS